MGSSRLGCCSGNRLLRLLAAGASVTSHSLVQQYPRGSRRVFHLDCSGRPVSGLSTAPVVFKLDRRAASFFALARAGPEPLFFDLANAPCGGYRARRRRALLASMAHALAHRYRFRARAAG